MPVRGFKCPKSCEMYIHVICKTSEKHGGRIREDCYFHFYYYYFYYYYYYYYYYYCFFHFLNISSWRNGFPDFFVPKTMPEDTHVPTPIAIETKEQYVVAGSCCTRNLIKTLCNIYHETFAKIGDRQKPLIIFAKFSIADI